MLARSFQIGHVVWLLLWLAAACDSASPSISTDAGHDGGRSRMRDAGSSSAQPVNSMGNSPRNPFPFFDGGFPSFAPPSGCVQRLGAECDDSADCPNGKVCCGHVDTTTVSYDYIECQKSCSGPDQFRLCHSSDGCGAGLVCRSSLRIPYSVCAPQVPGTAPSQGRELQGRVACGSASCEVGREQCCLTAYVDQTSLLPRAEKPYCASLRDPDACQCNHHQDPPEPDAGAQDAGD